eukprot:GCRY01003003.1.p1 GENE.GCRY01003003.1~~GCRY01003003.1.p1  ORF type:complete len:372 (-),score=88.28 GCRY01003003.1:409-1524(-)
MRFLTITPQEDDISGEDTVHGIFFKHKKTFLGLKLEKVNTTPRYFVLKDNILRYWDVDGLCVAGSHRERGSYDLTSCTFSHFSDLGLEIKCHYDALEKNLWLTFWNEAQLKEWETVLGRLRDGLPITKDDLTIQAPHGINPDEIAKGTFFKHSRSDLGQLRTINSEPRHFLLKGSILRYWDSADKVGMEKAVKGSYDLTGCEVKNWGTLGIELFYLPNQLSPSETRAALFMFVSKRQKLFWSERFRLFQKQHASIVEDKDPVSPPAFEAAEENVTNRNTEEEEECNGNVEEKQISHENKEGIVLDHPQKEAKEEKEVKGEEEEEEKDDDEEVKEEKEDEEVKAQAEKPVEELQAESSPDSNTVEDEVPQQQ